MRFQISDPYTVTLYNRGTGEDAYVYDSDASREVEDSWYYSRVFYLDADEYDMTWDAGLHLKDRPEEPDHEEPPNREEPKTGDDSSLLLWITLFAVSATGIIYVIIDEKKQKKFNTIKE